MHCSSTYRGADIPTEVSGLLLLAIAINVGLELSLVSFFSRLSSSNRGLSGVLGPLGGACHTRVTGDYQVSSSDVISTYT